MMIHRKLWMLLAASMLLTGCPKETEDAEDDSAETKKKKDKDKDDDDDDGDDDDGSAKTAEPAPSVDVAPDVDNNAAIQPRVKAEVDGREDGLSDGTTLASGGAAAWEIPKDWKKGSSSGFQTATSADGKSAFASGGTGNDSPTTKLETAQTALGYTDCNWGSTESVVVGKDKLAGTAADGVCKKGGNLVRTAYVALSAEKVVAMGGWEDAGGDSATVFNIFRAGKKAAVGSGNGVAACCAAIKQNMQSAPPAQLPVYQGALAACQGLMSNPAGVQALAGVRGMLAAVGVPGGCQ